MATRSNTDIAEALTILRKHYGLKAGSKVYTTVKNVSRSGLTRTIAVYAQHKGEIHDISHLVATATGMRFDRDRGGVKVEGCGMDMTFHVVYSLSSVMFPKGHRCTGTDRGARRCPSNDHVNDYGASRRLAEQELEAEGVDLTIEEWPNQRHQVSARAEEIRERDGLTYRKGRIHRDGGYALTRVHL